MTKNVNAFATVETVLAATVANNGTFTVNYPSGTSQATYSSGLAGASHVMIVNDNDEYFAPTSFSAAFGASTITVTNTTGVSMAAGARVLLQFDIVDGNQIVFLEFPIELASITGAQDVVTTFPVGFDGVIEDVRFVTNKAVTTAAKLATLGLTIGTTAVTGGVVALTSATVTPMGAIVAGSAITGANVVTKASTISVKASAVTAFAEGSGTLIVRGRKNPSNAY